MNAIDSNTAAIIAREVPDNERLQMLPKHFGRDMLTVESAIFAFMRKLCAGYNGGWWVYYELSNRGFYMAPRDEALYGLTGDGNSFSGDLSADAAGITACLFALSHISFRVNSDNICFATLLLSIAKRAPYSRRSIDRLVRQVWESGRSSRPASPLTMKPHRAARGLGPRCTVFHDLSH
jgi:Antirestriction protein